MLDFGSFQMGAVPLAYARALGLAESGWNGTAIHRPASVTPEAWKGMDLEKRLSYGTAAGLFQITESVRAGTGFSRADLLNPAINAQIAMDLLQRIVKAYAKHPALQTDWNSRRWVELLTYGWNAGYSEQAGVGYVVGKMERAGIPTADITARSVYAVALEDRIASRHLKNPAKVAYAAKVAGAYLAALGSQAAGGGPGLAALLVPAALLGLVVVGASRKKRR